MALFEPIFRALDDAGVRYVAVGGVAVVLHGHARLTTDLDLVVDLAPTPATAAVRALTSIGFQPRLPVDAEGFADAAIRQGWIDDKGMAVFSMWDPTDPTRAVDLFVVPPMDFEGLWSRSSLVDVGTMQARIASIPDLITMKTISDRPLDRDDIDALRTILSSEDDA